MSGHSKWSTIKRQKQSEDKKRGQQFTKLARAITLAVREGGGIDDPAANFKLRLAMDRAKQANMPKDNITRAIDRGSGKGSDGVVFESILYEGYGPFGVALLIETATDNKQRTASQIKHALDRAGGSLGAPGSVSYQFKQEGYVFVKKGTMSDEALFEKAIEHGASDVADEDSVCEIYTERDNLHAMQDALASTGLEIDDAGLVYRPNTPISLADDKQAQKLYDLVTELEELDDVQHVYPSIVLDAS